MIILCAKLPISKAEESVFYISVPHNRVASGNTEEINPSWMSSVVPKSLGLINLVFRALR